MEIEVEVEEVKEVKELEMGGGSWVAGDLGGLV